MEYIDDGGLIRTEAGLVVGDNEASVLLIDLECPYCRDHKYRCTAVVPMSEATAGRVYTGRFTRLQRAVRKDLRRVGIDDSGLQFASPRLHDDEDTVLLYSGGELGIPANLPVYDDVVDVADDGDLRFRCASETTMGDWVGHHWCLKHCFACGGDPLGCGCGDSD